RGEDGIPRPALESAIVRMLGEARRAADVVGRLREFFRTGTTHLEAVTAGELLASARRIGAGLNESGDVSFEAEARDIGPHLMVDRLQIELVLRNLIANAFEAVASQPRDTKRVTVSAHEVDEGRILFRVVDTGPGVPPSRRAGLFEPFSGAKSTGM